jgi:hypothetical protein
MTSHTTPDISTELNTRDVYDRESFRVDDRTFTRTEPGTYTDGKITAYCDQQDSKSWGARAGKLHTGYYWTPEYAVIALLDSIATV